MATVLRILEDIRQGQMGPSSLMDVRDLTRMLSFPEGVNVRASGSFGDVRTGQLDGFGKVALKTITVRGVGRGNLRTTKVLFLQISILLKPFSQRGKTLRFCMDLLSLTLYFPLLEVLQGSIYLE